jgi:hypothetical protein
MAHSISIKPCCASPFHLVTPARIGSSAPRSLMEAIQSVTQQIPETQLRPITTRAIAPPFRPSVLLALLTYCYATDVFSTSEICDQVLKDAACAEICNGTFPPACALRTFRDNNRQELEKCLASALCFVEERNAVENLSSPLDLAAIAEEAKRRIIMAACLDRMELDGIRFS